MHVLTIVTIVTIEPVIGNLLYVDTIEAVQRHQIHLLVYLFTFYDMNWCVLPLRIPFN